MKVKVCPKCSKYNLENAKYCTDCSENLSNVTPMDTVQQEKVLKEYYYKQALAKQQIETSKTIEASKPVEQGLASEAMVNERLYPEGYYQVDKIILIIFYAAGVFMCCLAILYWISEHTGNQIQQNPMVSVLVLGGNWVTSLLLGCKTQHFTK